jgi:hypothetical protein
LSIEINISHEEDAVLFPAVFETHQGAEYIKEISEKQQQ